MWRPVLEKMIMDLEVMVIAEWKQAHFSLLSLRLMLAADDTIQECQGNLSRLAELRINEEMHLIFSLTSVMASF